MHEWLIQKFEVWCVPVVVQAETREEALETMRQGGYDDTRFAPEYYDSTNLPEMTVDFVHELKAAGGEFTTPWDNFTLEFARLKGTMTEEQRQHLLGELTLNWALEGRV